METVTMKGGNNNIITYERENKDATAYHKDTPMEVRRVLDNVMISRDRIRIFYGEDGKDWHEDFDIMGYVSRSTGNIKIPLLIHNSRSIGGGAILDHRIVKIMEGYRILYQHPKYNAGEFSELPSDLGDYHTNVYIDGKLHARFKKPGQARRWIDFMTGKRMSK
jgi:hypothetical protein